MDAANLPPSTYHFFHPANPSQALIRRWCRTINSVSTTTASARSASGRSRRSLAATTIIGCSSAIITTRSWRQKRPSLLRNSIGRCMCRRPIANGMLAFSAGWPSWVSCRAGGGWQERCACLLCAGSDRQFIGSSPIIATRCRSGCCAASVRRSPAMNPARVPIHRVRELPKRRASGNSNSGKRLGLLLLG